MKKQILAATLAAGALFTGVSEAEAGHKCQRPGPSYAHVCCKPFARMFPGRVVMRTEKVKSECYYKEECVNGCWKKVLYVKTTYADIYCNGKVKHWTVVARG